MMVTEIEYALLAGASYRDTRADINRFPIPTGWNLVSREPQDGATGFEASAFGNGATIATSTEIVISFAGTGPGLTNPDWAANIALATNLGSVQLLQAAEYYAQVKMANPNANITFTGHSLGGGLAALMGAFFNKTAVTFDQAPFLNSVNASIAMGIMSDLLAKFPPETNLQITGILKPLADFIATTNLLTDSVAARIAKVTGTNTQGEILSTTFPFTLFNKIGAQTSIDHGAYGSGTDLHAQSLLTAMLQSGDTATSTAANHTLGQVTYKLTDLLAMIFDPQLFYNDPNRLINPQRNLLEHLVRHEAGGVDGVSVNGDAMVTRFTADLWKLVQEGGLTLTDGNGGFFSGATNNVSNALIAFAMQFYYENSANAKDATKQLFTQVTGGLQFDMYDVSKEFARTFAGSGKGGDLDKVKGYEYFKQYLAQSNNSLNAIERQFINSILPNMRDWTIQAGTGGMNVTDTYNRNAFMLGNNNSDALVGGSGTDLLVGNGGDDLLQGKGGNDFLLGGSGNDSYVYTSGDGFDTIYDSDGNGSIAYDGAILSGGAQFGDDKVHRDADGRLYVDVGNGRFVIDGNILIEGHQAGELGLMGMTGPVAEVDISIVLNLHRDSHNANTVWKNGAVQLAANDREGRMAA